MRILRTLLSGVLALSLSGCASEYVDHNESLTSGSGEAIARNILVHAVDPWPRQAFDARVATSGSRAARAIRQYECGAAGNGSSQGQGMTININNAPGGSAGANGNSRDQGC